MTTTRTLTEAAADLGRKLDTAREDTGEALHSAASSVRTTRDKSTDAIDKLATGAAEHLDEAAYFVEDYELRDIVVGLRNFGRRHLTGTMIVAAAAGFLAGSALCRATHSWRRPNSENHDS